MQAILSSLKTSVKPHGSPQAFGLPDPPQPPPPPSSLALQQRLSCLAVGELMLIMF